MKPNITRPTRPNLSVPVSEAKAKTGSINIEQSKTEQSKTEQSKVESIQDTKLLIEGLKAKYVGVPRHNIFLWLKTKPQTISEEAYLKYNNESNTRRPF